ncbi:diguanylate cyclase, partial [Desulfovibrio sp. OttesenSCG-928-C14]|nr:diguanylate cyclase [Desulfovibrio sp. OttesenSCG-928-C14]
MSELKFNGVLLTTDQDLKDRFRDLWNDASISWKVFAKPSETMHSVLGTLPDILVCSMDFKEMNGLQLVSMVKSENIYRQVPVLICVSPEEFKTLPETEGAEYDDFFILPGSDAELKARIELCIRRARRSLDTNPLTRLPGNTSIINYLQDCIDRKEQFSMGYCDLDFFKSFNDRYGFARGDEVLMMT